LKSATTSIIGNILRLSLIITFRRHLS